MEEGHPPSTNPGIGSLPAKPQKARGLFGLRALLAKHIQPVAEAAGFGRLGFQTFRHSFVSWGKAALKLSETKELARHANLATTSDIYGGLSLDAKRDAQTRLAEYVREEAKKSLGPAVSA